MIKLCQRIKMKKTLFILICSSLTLFGATQTSMDIYTNKAFINKSFTLKDKGKLEIAVPAYTSLDAIGKNFDDGCKVTNTNLSQSIALQDTLSKHIQELKDSKIAISHKLEALEAKKALLHTLSLQNISEPSSIDTLTNYLSSELIKISQQHNALNQELKKIDGALNKEPQIREYKELSFDYKCEKPTSTLAISYPLKDIKIASFYNLDANTQSKSVVIEKNINIDYIGIENFENIDLNIYSYAQNQSVAPQIFRPEYLTNIPQMRMLKSQAAPAMQEISLDAQLIELGSKSVYTIKNAKINSGEKNLILVDKEEAKATFKSMIDGYGTAKAYLQATINTVKNYTRAPANYLLNAKPVAKLPLESIQKGKDIILYFGEDEYIQVEKELIKTLDEKTFFTDQKVSTQNWRFKIRNKKSSVTDIEFVHRTPVSKDADITVKTLAAPNYTSQNAEGKTVWSFTLDPNEGKSIIFGYEISKAN